MHERCGTNPWRSTPGRCFPHIAACPDCFAGPEKSERKGLGELCQSRRFPGQPWVGIEHRSRLPTGASDRRGESCGLRGGPGCSRLSCATLEGFLGNSRSEGLSWCAICHSSPPAPAPGYCVLRTQRCGFERELARFYIHKSPRGLSTEGFCFSGTWEGNTGSVTSGGWHPGTHLQVGSPAVPCPGGLCGGKSSLPAKHFSVSVLLKYSNRWL